MHGEDCERVWKETSGREQNHQSTAIQTECEKACQKRPLPNAKINKNATSRTQQVQPRLRDQPLCRKTKQSRLRHDHGVFSVHISHPRTAGYADCVGGRDERGAMRLLRLGLTISERPDESLMEGGSFLGRTCPKDVGRTRSSSPIISDCLLEGELSVTV
ncbi:hypothetical protein VTO42DRAFT_3783 [Malbranchea cinnamomea]